MVSTCLMPEVEVSREAPPARLWQENSNRLVSLYEMFQRDAARFVWIGNAIQSFYSNFTADARPTAVVTPEQKAGLLEALSGIHQTCQEMGLSKTQVILESTIHSYEGDWGHTRAHLKDAISYIDARFKAELQEHVFVQIDPERSMYMKTAEQFVQAPIFGPKVAAQFRTAMPDAREAGVCFAAYRHTACVFHCMRVVEKGLIALANAVPVPFTIPFEYENWINIIESIEKKIRNLEQQLPKGQAKSDTLKFYSESASQFIYFKNAWRNHVAHARDTYDGEQAKLILEHVGYFMGFLAEGGLRG